VTSFFVSKNCAKKDRANFLPEISNGKTSSKKGDRFGGQKICVTYIAPKND